MSVYTRKTKTGRERGVRRREYCFYIVTAKRVNDVVSRRKTLKRKTPLLGFDGGEPDLTCYKHAATNLASDHLLDCDDQDDDDDNDDIGDDGEENVAEDE